MHARAITTRQKYAKYAVAVIGIVEYFIHKSLYIFVMRGIYKSVFLKLHILFVRANNKCGGIYRHEAVHNMYNNEEIQAGD